MRVEKIPTFEAKFDQNGIDSHGKKFLLTKNSIQIPGEATMMDYTRIKPDSGDESFYYKEKIDKDQIVLHYTVGYLKGDVATLTTPDNHVSVPFIIGRNGTIYNLFYSAYWSYHLGFGAKGGNKTRSSKTIGIELSNIGPLKQTDQGMKTIYDDIYCENDQLDQYIVKPYRRFDNYATFTGKQYDSLIVLLKYLTARYKIERKFMKVPDRFETDASVVGFGGIVSHVNYREVGKEDIGPGFDWYRVIEGTGAVVAYKF